MDIGIIAMRYAKALMEYGENTNTTQKLYTEVIILSKNINSCKRLRQVLDNPILSIREKYSLICVAAVGSLDVSHEFSRFITLVLKNHREFYLQYICMSFLNLYRKKEHIGIGRLVTAVPIDAMTKNRIQQSAGMVLNVKMEIDNEVDDSIDGGFIFDYEGYRLDASVLAQLKRIKQQFIEKNRRIV